jgi:hypothetical protein
MIDYLQVILEILWFDIEVIVEFETLCHTNGRDEKHI